MGDTSATTHKTSFLVGTINHRTAASTDVVVLGISGPPANTKLIVDCPITTEDNLRGEIKEDNYIPESRYNLCRWWSKEMGTLW